MAPSCSPTSSTSLKSMRSLSCGKELGGLPAAIPQLLHVGRAVHDRYQTESTRVTPVTLLTSLIGSRREESA